MKMRSPTVRTLQVMPSTGYHTLSPQAMCHELLVISILAL
ncbi:unnamed protein product [Amoebophrya sp. A25]|nr:unnamed protein product [Amoebophrya sp. A25]|eukprot:GSA25T00004171001.1